ALAAASASIARAVFAAGRSAACAQNFARPAPGRSGRFSPARGYPRRTIRLGALPGADRRESASAPARRRKAGRATLPICPRSSRLRLRGGPAAREDCARPVELAQEGFHRRIAPVALENDRQGLRDLFLRIFEKLVNGLRHVVQVIVEQPGCAARWRFDPASAGEMDAAHALARQAVDVATRIEAE